MAGRAPVNIVDEQRFCQCNGAATPSVPPLKLVARMERAGALYARAMSVGLAGPRGEADRASCEVAFLVEHLEC